MSTGSSNLDSHVLSSNSQEAFERLKLDPKSPSGLDSSLESHLTNQPAVLNVSSLSSGIYILQNPALRSTAQLTNLSYSYIDLSLTVTTTHPLSTLTVKNASSCLLNCGRIGGPAHMTGIENSTVIIWSQQVRFHDCKNSKVYLRCSSRPIIENCTGMLFAPLPESIVSKGYRANSQAVTKITNLSNRRERDLQWRLGPIYGIKLTISNGFGQSRVPIGMCLIPKMSVR